MSLTLSVDRIGVDVICGCCLPYGYGHKKIEVLIMYRGEVRKFKSTTSAMQCCDNADDLVGKARYIAYYRIIEHDIYNSISEFFAAVDDRNF